MDSGLGGRGKMCQLLPDSTGTEQQLPWQLSPLKEGFVPEENTSPDPDPESPPDRIDNLTPDEAPSEEARVGLGYQTGQDKAVFVLRPCVDRKSGASPPWRKLHPRGRRCGGLRASSMATGASGGHAGRRGCDRLPDIEICPGRLRVHEPVHQLSAGQLPARLPDREVGAPRTGW